MNYHPVRSALPYRPTSAKLYSSILLKIHAKITKLLFFAFFRVKKYKPPLPKAKAKTKGRDGCLRLVRLVQQRELACTRLGFERICFWVSQSDLIQTPESKKSGNLAEQPSLKVKNKAAEILISENLEIISVPQPNLSVSVPIGGPVGVTALEQELRRELENKLLLIEENQKQASQIQKYRQVIHNKQQEIATLSKSKSTNHEAKARRQHKFQQLMISIKDKYEVQQQRLQREVYTLTTDCIHKERIIGELQWMQEQSRKAFDEMGQEIQSKLGGEAVNVWALRRAEMEAGWWRMACETGFYPERYRQLKKLVQSPAFFLEMAENLLPSEIFIRVKEEYDRLDPKLRVLGNLENMLKRQQRVLSQYGQKERDNSKEERWSMTTNTM